MKKIIYCTLILSVLLVSSGCKKYLDINKDPNNPSDVSESLILAPVIAAVSTNVAGGSFSQLNYNGVSEITSYWMQQIALNQPQPQVDGYKLRPDDDQQAWDNLYSTILQNLKLLDAKATKNGNNSYGVIAKILTAYSLGIATDMWGDVPYSKALNGLSLQFKSPYDKQEDIYKNLQSMLDSAIAQNQKPTGAITPYGDDYLYGGDMAKWEKFAYSLKARYYIHLTKAPGYNSTTQANLALTAIQNAFGTASDEANFSSYSSSAGSESPWFVNTGSDQGGVVLASTLINDLVIRNDPRLPIIAKKGSSGSYLGKEIGTDPAPNPNIYSKLNLFYAADKAKQSIMSYAEILFLKAEATLIVSGAGVANPIYVDAINAGMTRLGLTTTDPNVTNYITTRNLAYSANPLKALIEDKVVANLLSSENYNDWRRTGYPSLTIVQNSFTPTIPVRFTYSLDERNYNPQPEQSATYSTPIWWAQ